MRQFQPEVISEMFVMAYSGLCGTVDFSLVMSKVK